MQAWTRLKLEAPDGGRFLGEAFEILRQEPCKLHQQPNGEEHQQQGGQEDFPKLLTGLGHHSGLGNGDGQIQGLVRQG